MSQIRVSNLTFGYEGSFDNIFEEVSFSVDTAWKLGFVGRNGKGKTTFLNLLLGKYEYSGCISSSVVFDYFPYTVSEKDSTRTAEELMEVWKPGVEGWRVLCELPALGLDAAILYRPFRTLSFGERTKVMLAVLFSGENDFLLIDEPTNHLDREARALIKEYLAGKKGFILVSHDRDLLDACVDHILVLNRSSIEVQAGNFSGWWENKEKADLNAKAENEKHLSEIEKLRAASERAARWAEKNESTKIGFDPVREHDRSKGARAFIGAKTKKMQARVKSYETRIAREIAETLTDLGLPCTTLESSSSLYKNTIDAGNFDMYLGMTRLSPDMDLTEFFRPYGEMSRGGLSHEILYNMCLKGLEDTGNYYNFYQKLAEDGRIIPLMFGYYNVYAHRGELPDLNPSRDNVFYYSMGKTMEDILIEETGEE